MTRELRALGRAVDANEVVVRLPVDLWAMLSASSEWHRAVETRKEFPPTAEEWAEYDRAMSLLDQLRESPYFEDGDDGATVNPPRPHVTVKYAETREEWLARIQAMIDAGKRPDAGDFELLYRGGDR